jgi:hypothetical protein
MVCPALIVTSLGIVPVHVNELSTALHVAEFEVKNAVPPELNVAFTAAGLAVIPPVAILMWVLIVIV